MSTAVVSVDPARPAAEPVARAAQVLRDGGLVAFPTETVYGLGANALEPAAVARIFLAKGRPATNPIIVHVADAGAARALTTTWPASAERLANHFWPGPLSLVLPKQPIVPDIATAGGSTIGLRVPAHPVALALIRAAGVPIAAPSANRSCEISATRAEHVLRGLDGRIDLLLDAGPTPGGIESTVIDLTTEPPRLLRPGLISLAELVAVIGTVLPPRAVVDDETLRSPGQLARHYAPRTATECSDHGERRVRELLRQQMRVGWLRIHKDEASPLPGVAQLVVPADPVACAAQFYAALHVLDAAGLDRIVIDQPPEGETWLAIRDRVRRAAAAVP